MSRAVIQIPLDIPDVEVEKIEIKVKKGIVITVRSTLNTARCQRCGREIDSFHGYGDWVQVRHLPILEQAVYIRYRPKRYRCPHCEGGPTTTQQLNWHEANSPYTRAFEDYVLKMLVNSTVEDVRMKVGIGYGAVVGILERGMAAQVDWTRFTRLEVLGMDEIALKKGHGDYAAIVSTRLDNEQVVVLAVLPNRRKTTLEAFLSSIPAALRTTLHSVCVDMYDSYHQAVKSVLPHVQIVIDRFHVVQKYADEADKVRRDEMNRLKATLPRANYQTLRDARIAFRKHPEQLTPAEHTALARLFQHAPRLRTVHAYREGLFAIFQTATTKAAAQDQLRTWMFLVREQHVPGFDAFLHTLETFWNEITNFFVQRLTSGFVEGLNAKIRVLLRRAYGLFNPKHLFQRLSLDLEGYQRFA